MKTRRNNPRQLILKILIVVPVVAVLIISVSSCGKSKSPELLLSDIAPPPPPPPIPSSLTADSIYQSADEMPLIPGGEAALFDYINANIIYPYAAKTKGIQGKIIVRFIVDAAGNVGSATILKGADPLLDEEALRVVRKLPKFKPGVKDGKAVAVYYVIPINFTLK